MNKWGIEMDVTNVLKENIQKILFDEELKAVLFDFIEYKATEGFRFADLVLTFNKLFGGNGKEIEVIAAAMECLILSLDIFDDIEDGDNSAPPWTTMPQNIVINAASCLLMVSSQMIDDCNFEVEKVKKAKALFNKCVMESISGQHHDISNNIKTEEDYLRVTRQKSGGLLSLACQLGVVFASDKYIKEIKDFGELLGLKAQIDNDIRDVVSDNEKNDLLHKKMTLPILYLINQRADDFPLIIQYYSGLITKESFQNNLNSIIPDIRTSGAIEYALVIGRLKELEAKQIVKQLNVDEQKRNILFALFPQ